MRFLSLLILSSIWHIAFANSYVGFEGGYGSTTWGQVVASRPEEIDAMQLSTPISVNEGGVVWGMIAGYELIPEFALEMNYQRFPDAKLTFSPFSFFAYDYGQTQFITHTESVSFSGKYIVQVPHTAWRAFSLAGAAVLHRWDMLTNRRRITATFGVGFNYPIKNHWLVDIRFNYVAGYGESELNPTNDFMPFLYSGMISLLYQC